MPDLMPNVKPGDIITANFLNEIIKNQNNRDVAITGDGLTVRRDDRHIQITAKITKLGFPCTVSTAITARSGTTPGKGKVQKMVLHVDSSGNGTLNNSSASPYTVWCVSSTTGGIPIGTYGNANYDENGNLWFQTADCGN